MPTDSPTPREAADRVVARRLGALQAEHTAQNAQLEAIRDSSTKSVELQGSTVSELQRMNERGDRAEQRAVDDAKDAKSNAEARWAWLRKEWRWLMGAALVLVYLAAPALRPAIAQLTGWGVSAATTATTAALPAEPAHLEEAWDEPEAAPEPEPVVLEVEPEAATDG